MTYINSLDLHYHMCNVTSLHMRWMVNMAKITMLMSLQVLMSLERPAQDYRADHVRFKNTVHKQYNTISTKSGFHYTELPCLFGFQVLQHY